MLTEKEKTLIRLLENKNNTPLDIINWIRHHLIKKARRDFAEKLKIRLRKFTDTPHSNIKEGTTENDIEKEIDEELKP